MKIDAKIKWLIDKPQLGIEVDKLETVSIDMDYTESDEYSITAAVEDELAEKYGISFYDSQYDFTIMNMNDLIEDISYDEFEDKTEYSRI